MDYKLIIVIAVVPAKSGLQIYRSKLKQISKHHRLSEDFKKGFVAKRILTAIEAIKKYLCIMLKDTPVQSNGHPSSDHWDGAGFYVGNIGNVI